MAIPPDPSGPWSGPEAALALLRDDPEEAAALIQTIPDAFSRTMAWIDAVAAMPDGDRDGKLRWVDRALLDARSIKEPANRLIAMAALAEHLLDLGQTERAPDPPRERADRARTGDRGVGRLRPRPTCRGVLAGRS